jgi:hypothetical protein
MVVKRCARLRRQDLFVKSRDASVVFVECADGRKESEEGSDLNLSIGTEQRKARLEFA